MKRTLFAVLFIITFTLLAQSTSSIEGTVIDAATDRPLPGVIVALSGPSKPITTDEQGHFVIDNVSTGRYRLVPTLKNYVFLIPNERSRTDHVGLVLDVPGSGLRNIQVRMAREASLSGTVLKPDGKPVIGTTGSAGVMKYTYNELGERMLRYAQGVGSGAYFVRPNDRGEFRIFGIPPGDYYVSFQGGGQTYFPGVTDEAKATTLHIGAGEEITLPPVIVPPFPGTEVRFHFSGTELRGGRTLNVDRNFMWGFGGSAVPNDITVTIPPGRHDVLASAGGIPQGLDYARITLDVGVTSMDRSIELHPAPRIKTTVIIEDEAKGKLTANNRICRLRSKEPTRSAGLCDSGQITPAHYTLELAELAADTYVVSAQVNGADILANGFDVNSDTEIVVRLSTPGAIVQGKVRDAVGNLLADAIVAVVPDAPLRNAGPLYRAANSDLNGNFIVRGLAPGNYHVYAWPELEGTAYRNADFMKPFDDKGKPLQLRKGATIETDLVAF